MCNCAGGDRASGLRSLLVLGYPDVFSAGDHVPEVLAHKPIGLEVLELMPEGDCWLLVKFCGESKDESDDKAKKPDGGAEKTRKSACDEVVR